MRKLAAVLFTLGVVAVATASPIAATDFGNPSVTVSSATGPLDLFTHTGSTVEAGIASATWSAGPGLTATGTPPSNCVWGTGWNDEAGDYIKLSVVFGAAYQGTIDELRYATRASSSGPHSGTVVINVNGSPAYTHNFTNTGTNYLNEDITGLSVAVPAGGTVDVIWTATGATSTSGTWRVNTYYTGTAYLPTGIFGTVTPEPVSFVLLGLGLALIRRR
jgi:hypothetical protein